MKSNFLKSIVYIVALGMITFSCSTDTDKLPVNFETLVVSGGAFASQIASEGSTDINRDDAASSSFSKTYTLTTPAPALGSDVNLVELFVSFAGANVSAGEILYASAGTGDFDTSSGGYPEVTFSVAGDQVLSGLGLVPAQLEGGDSFNFRLALTTPKGTFSDVSANFDNQSADHRFSSTVVCLPAIIPAGDYVVAMVDTFGDGWQTTTASGGDPITITLSSGDVLEVGMCTIYEASAFACVDGPSQASDVVTIPAGITSAEWFFPGDQYGEISFTITGPNSGEIIYDSPQGAGAGVLALNLCNE
ncbi:MAG: hypothetical protein WBN27_08920 [Eudoraea sp.]|uniref:hypothetical protein n=1 Tax=Eudoraea sp. TaxID=1979955 RepID=UPI003C711913